MVKFPQFLITTSSDIWGCVNIKFRGWFLSAQTEVMLPASHALVFAQEKYILIVSIQWIGDGVNPGVRLDAMTGRKMASPTGIKSRFSNRI
jgi:hypothetical protein